MFLFRTTFLLGIGVFLLPTDPQNQARVFGAARTATHWTMTFCDRNPETCVQGRQAWAVFVQKAEFGAKMAYNLMSERTAAVEPAPAHAERRAATPSPRAAQKASDLQPGLRGAATRQGG